MVYDIVSENVVLFFIFRSTTKIKVLKFLMSSKRRGCSPWYARPVRHTNKVLPNIFLAKATKYKNSKNFKDIFLNSIVL